MPDFIPMGFETAFWKRSPQHEEEEQEEQQQDE